MFTTLKKIFNKYSEFITKIITYLGLTVIYLIGIGLGKILLCFLKSDKKQQRWQKIKHSFDPDTMY